ncbi:MAG: cation:proton antiporter [Vampirovibrionia bacterium]
MHNSQFLLDLAIIFIVASVTGMLISKLKQPAIVAYILTGVLLGPNVFGLVSDEELVNQLSHVGVIALLFTLGLEFSLSKFNQMRNSVLFTGSMQIIGTLVVVCLLLLMFNFNITQSILIGSAIALSSTVVVLRTLTSSNQIDSLHGRIIVGILIIQDLSLIPIMIILPNLTAGETITLLPIIYAVLKAGFFLVLAIFVSFWLTPKLMDFITSTNKEFLIFSSIAIAISTALVATLFGISMELGAFVAGLALSGTVQSKQVIVEVTPLRDVFAMIFFVSIGLMLDISFFISNLPMICLVVVLIILIKFLVTFFVVFAAKQPGQTAVWAGLSLFQIGEFSFIITQLGYSEKVINENIYSLLITSTLMTMLLTPFVIKSIPSFITLLEKQTWWNKYFRGPLKVEADTCELCGHVIISGFGPIGRSIAKVLTLGHQDYIVIEMNNKTIQELKSENISAIYGDASHEEILHHSNIDKAKILIVTLPDTKTTERAIFKAREMNKDIFIIARSRYQFGIQSLYDAGANVVVYEEYETSLGIISKILGVLNYTKSEIETIVDLAYASKYNIIHNICDDHVASKLIIKSIKENEVEWIKVTRNHLIANKQIKDCNIREKTGASILSITKDNNNILNPVPETVINEGDVLAVLVNQKQKQLLKTFLQS